MLITRENHGCTSASFPEGGQWRVADAGLFSGLPWAGPSQTISIPVSILSNPFFIAFFPCPGTNFVRDTQVVGGKPFFCDLPNQLRACFVTNVRAFRSSFFGPYKGVIIEGN